MFEEHYPKPLSGELMSVSALIAVKDNRCANCDGGKRSDDHQDMEPSTTSKNEMMQSLSDR